MQRNHIECAVNLDMTIECALFVYCRVDRSIGG